MSPVARSPLARDPGPWPLAKPRLHYNPRLLDSDKGFDTRTIRPWSVELALLPDEKPPNEVAGHILVKILEGQAYPGATEGTSQPPHGRTQTRILM